MAIGRGLVAFTLSPVWSRGDARFPGGGRNRGDSPEEDFRKMMTVATFGVASVLAFVHVFGGRLAGAVEAESHSRGVSVGAGVTVAFVFLYLMPELDYFRRLLEAEFSAALVDEALYLAALVGVTIYYGLEHLAHEVRPDPAVQADEESSFGHDYVFWTHVGWYAVYNVIIGAFLTHGEQETVQGLVIYGAAMGVHFLAVDATMRRHHRHVYRASGRWLLAAAVLVGWLVGAVVPVGAEVLAVVMAFLIGGLLINAIKDEVPPSEQARFGPFLAGVVGFSLLLVVV